MEDFVLILIIFSYLLCKIQIIIDMESPFVICLALLVS